MARTSLCARANPEAEIRQGRRSGALLRVQEGYAPVKCPPDGRSNLTWPFPGADKQRGEQRIGFVAPEKVVHHPVGDPQGPAQHGPVIVFDRHEAPTYEGGGAGQPATRPAIGHPRATEFEGQAHAGSAPHYVVVEVAVQLLEGRVEVGSQPDQQQVHIEGFEVEGQCHVV